MQKLNFLHTLYFHCKQNVGMVIKSVKIRQREREHVAGMREMQ
jgi:hypothetical protein